MRATLEATITLLALAGTFIGPLAATAAEADSHGSLTVDGIEMNVHGAVAVWNEENGRLSLALLPFEPTDTAIDLVRQGYETRIEHELVDPESWPHANPRASFSLSWFEPADRGDFSKANVHLYAFGIGAENQNLNLNYMMSFVEDGTIEGRLSGSMQAGEEIHLVSQGEDVLSDSTVAWELDVRTTIYTPLPRD